MSRALGPESPADHAIHIELEALSNRAVEVCSGVACLITWRSNEHNGTAGMLSNARWRSALDAVLMAMERQFEPLPLTVETVSIAPGQLMPLITETLAGGTVIEGTAARLAVGDRRVATILLTSAGRSTSELVALARLTTESASAIIASHVVRASRDFWRSAGTTGGAKLAEVRAALEAQHAKLGAAVARATQLRPRQRFMGLGKIFAEMGPFDDWIVAIARDDGLSAEAASRAFGSLPRLNGTGTVG